VCDGGQFTHFLGSELILKSEYRMSFQRPNSKYEIRSLKEVRNSKFDNRDEIVSGGEDDSAFWQWFAEPVEALELREDAERQGPFDLLERTASFGESIVKFAKQIPQGPVNNRLIDQLVGAGTSVGANYCEANDSVSKKDFRNKIGTCRKESKETMFFLRMVASSEPGLRDEARKLWVEAKELNLIFGAIFRG
jgi:four helix bundle protein